MKRTAAVGCAIMTALGLAVHAGGVQDTSGSQSAAGTYTGGNPATYITAVLLLTAVGVLACWNPAAKAMQIDPARVLREE